MTDAIMSENALEQLRNGRTNGAVEILDKEPNWLWRNIVPNLSKNVRTDEYVVEQIRDLAKQGPVLYALKYPSLFDLHFLRMRFAQLGLPVPSFVLGMSAFVRGPVGRVVRTVRGGFHKIMGREAFDRRKELDIMKSLLETGGAGIFCLVDENTFRQRYVDPELDPLRITLELQGQIAGCISIIPMFILYDRTRRWVIQPFWESFLGNPDRPGPIRRVINATRKYTLPELLIGEPIYPLSQFEEFGSERSWEELPFDLRNDLINSVNDRIRVNRGPEKLTRTQIKERVLRDQRVKRAVIELSQEENTSTRKIRKKAESYVEEIAADPYVQVHHILYHLLKWAFSLMFNKLDYRAEQFETLKQASARGALVVVPCHKSHLDYLLIGWLAFVNYMAVPYTAAGKNLNFWPIGPVLRHGGAFFLRRSFKGLKLYTQVFAAYVKVLAAEKSFIKFFPEGGRSRTGKLLPPRLGLLSFLLRAVDEGAVEDLCFAPAFVGYESVPEESSILTELAGKKKQKETLVSMLGARKLLTKNHGSVYVRFHKPLSYREFCQKRADLSGTAVLYAADAPDLIEKFAYHLMFGIVAATVVTPVDLTSAALISARNSKISEEEVFQAARTFCTILQDQGAELAQSLTELEKAIQTALAKFVLRGLLDVESSKESGGSTVYILPDHSRTSLEFYRNALINHLWQTAFIAGLLNSRKPSQLDIDPIMRADFAKLRDLFIRELIIDPLTQDEEILSNSFRLFHREGWLERSQPNAREQSVKRPLDYCYGFGADLLEFYYTALTALEDVKKEITQKEFGRKMVDISRELFPTPELGTRVFPNVSISNCLSRLHELELAEYDRSRRVLKPGAHMELILEWKIFIAKIINTTAS